MAIMNIKSIVNPRGRIICVGDLHGCYKEAVDLLKTCEVTPRDTVVFVGDLIDRGPDSASCVDLAMQREREQGSVSCILGNHEDRHLQYRDTEENDGQVNVRVATHIETRKQLRKEHYDYLRLLPTCVRLPQYNAAIVHAGAFSNVPLESQDRHHLLHIQMIDPVIDHDGRLNRTSKWPSKAPEHWAFWTHYWFGPERIIFGHSVLTEPLITDHAVGIDGGACFGLELWALVIPGWDIVRVKSKTNVDTGIRGRGNDRIKQYNIHGTVSTYS